MKKIVMFIYSIFAYAIAFASLLLWILSASNLIPEISIDGTPTMSFFWALMKNLGLICLFGIPHSIMARKSFKRFITKFLPKPIERSTYVLVAGILLTILVWYWEPMGGVIWNIEPQTTLYYVLYALFFTGWIILFVSTFLINHFDLFGLRQTYFELQNKPYTELNFKVYSFYKYVRHPLYLGGIIGVWATPYMTVTHLIFAILITSYFVIGTLFEEKDLIKEFGDTYKKYKRKTPMLIPFIKSFKS